MQAGVRALSLLGMGKGAPKRQVQRPQGWRQSLEGMWVHEGDPCREEGACARDRGLAPGRGSVNVRQGNENNS